MIKMGVVKEESGSVSRCSRQLKIACTSVGEREGGVAVTVSLSAVVD